MTRRGLCSCDCGRRARREVLRAKSQTERTCHWEPTVEGSLARLVARRHLALGPSFRSQQGHHSHLSELRRIPWQPNKYSLVCRRLQSFHDCHEAAFLQGEHFGTNSYRYEKTN